MPEYHNTPIRIVHSILALDSLAAQGATMPDHPLPHEELNTRPTTPLNPEPELIDILATQLAHNEPNSQGAISITLDPNDWQLILSALNAIPPTHSPTP